MRPKYYWRCILFNNMNKKKKIIVVDDDEIHLTALEFILQNEYEVYKMKSGNEVLSYLINAKLVPDLILLDILMPNIDGWEVLKRIKAISFLRKIPVVYITSIDEEDKKERAYEMGISDYITKPYDMAVLQKKIKDIIRNINEE